MDGRKLKEKVLSANVPLTTIAERMSVSPQALNSYFNGKDVRSGSIERIAEVLGVPVSFFYDDEKDARQAPAGNHPSVSLDPSVGQPYYDVDFEGGFMELANDQTSVPAANIVVRGFERADLWCNVTGHSMEPKINHGDIIALHRCGLDDVQFGEIYAVVLDNFRTIKILRRGKSPGNLLFVPINPDFDPQEYPRGRIRFVYEVIGAVSKFF